MINDILFALVVSGLWVLIKYTWGCYASNESRKKNRGDWFWWGFFFGCIPGIIAHVSNPVPTNEDGKG